MISMKRMLDDVRKLKSTPRVWRFRKEVPERVFLYVAPSTKVFSSWIRSLGFAVAFFLGPVLIFSFSTNAAFSDTDHLSSQTIGTGEWVPDIHFEEHDDCVKLSSSLPQAKIYYKFGHDGDLQTDGKIFDGKCIKIPEGEEKVLQARAFHPKHDQWRSEVVEKSFSRGRTQNYDEGDRDEREKQGGKKESDFAGKEQEVEMSAGENENEDGAVMKSLIRTRLRE